MELRIALRKARETGGLFVKEHVSVETEAGIQQITLTVEPLPGDGHYPLFRVTFGDSGTTARRTSAHATPVSSSTQDATIDQLELE
jgi:hypothetical protein